MPARTFAQLPVGACFAFDAESSRATRRKVDSRHTVNLPGGRRRMNVGDIDTRIHERACPTNFGRRRRRKSRKTKRSR